MGNFPNFGSPNHPSYKFDQIIKSALEAANPNYAIQQQIYYSGNHLNVNGIKYDLGKIRHIYLIGVGKASVAMAQGLIDLMGERITSGVIIQKQEVVGNMGLPKAIRLFQGAHPIPSEKSVEATQAVLSLAGQCNQDDLVFCLISGGGSSLMTFPVENVGLTDIQELTQLLLFCGAEIREINTIRKHLDQVKGGGLARLIYPAQLITLILSDVIGSPLDVIASGPSIADPSKYEDAITILEKYDLKHKTPVNIIKTFEKGLMGKIPETLKPDDPIFNRTQNVLVANNRMAAETAMTEAQKSGYNTMHLTSFLHGEARFAGGFLAGILKQTALYGYPLDRPACYIAGGETTVTITGNGKGGRNLEMALGAVEDLDGLDRVWMATLATDGEDGPTDAAGAWVTGDTYQFGKGLNLIPSSFLKNNDSYRYFETLGSLIKIGPSGTNVNDLVFLFAY